MGSSQWGNVLKIRKQTENKYYFEIEPHPWKHPIQGVSNCVYRYDFKFMFNESQSEKKITKKKFMKGENITFR